MRSSNGYILRVTGHLCGNSPVPGEFPAQRPVTRALMFSLICTWINGWVNNGEADDLRRHGLHYDVTVMITHSQVSYQTWLVIIQPFVPGTKLPIPTHHNNHAHDNTVTKRPNSFVRRHSFSDKFASQDKIYLFIHSTLYLFLWILGYW